ncbi:MAG TPA: hypothetical protein VGM41_21230 [Chitinophagaceae bacterium]|jgi:hypothetical protein
MNIEQKDYNSISPSAEYLMKLKAFTRIPFAKEAAALVIHGKDRTDTMGEADRAVFLRMLLHFENRYWTVEKLLWQTQPKNILEISSGYSFRGLDWCFQHPVHFIDTDLPDLVTAKARLVQSLITGNPAIMKGVYELLPLNVMDEAAFREVINKFPPGPITIINEGLLVYLGMEEKKRLCASIREALLQRGGYWVTGDIYLKREDDGNIQRPAHWQEFREKHQIYENSFDSYEAARQFFSDCGLEVNGREVLVPEALSGLELAGTKREAIIKRLESASSTRESWRLQARPY